MAGRKTDIRGKKKRKRERERKKTIGAKETKGKIDRRRGNTEKQKGRRKGEKKRRLTGVGAGGWEEGQKKPTKK